MTSPFTPQLGTNYCPRDEEILEIRDLLVEPLSRLKCIRNKITDLQKSIDELTKERDDINAYVDAHKALISPVRRLPLDIIQEIFVACLPTHRNCVMSAVEAPVLLGRVCSSWRAISLNTPRLWCRLHIVEPASFGPRSASFEEKLVQRLETTKTWLGRSGNCPLSISLEGSPAFRPSGGIQPIQLPAGFPPLVPGAVLIPFASRWQNITLCASWMALEVLSTLTEADVPRLRSMEINQRPDLMTPAMQWPTFTLFRAPNLTAFTFAGSQMDILDLPLQRENLTYLSLMGHGWGVLSCRIALEVLARCPRVQDCRLLVNEDNSANNMPGALPESSGRSLVELPFLRSLQVTSLGLAPSGIGRLFSRLVVPALRNFELRGRSNRGVEEPMFVDNFVMFLSTALSFESFTVDTQLFTRESFAGILGGLPTTTTRLSIQDRAVTRSGILGDDTIALLIPTPEHPGSCPALKELRILRCLSPSDAELLRFITARMTLPARTLRSVDIQFNRERQVDITPDIQPYVDGGLKVSTSYLVNQIPQTFSPWQGLADAPQTLGNLSLSQLQFA
ncbi:hypothetical protein B0H16DRAFT_1311600 [Mycena metata]|uniref:F-box domain-containing protein n=1 Tax=Mycena metata TaxID=1033252 RepID=A0AAD7JFB0_9AGAR|nr:hypothetical protein B0H16DRAFT_1311600 [Mycena metata]